MRTLFFPMVLMAGLLSPVLLHGQAWQLVWSDEFNAPANTPPSSQKWAMDTGGGGWGNQELETYSGSIDNVYQDGAGNLVIRAMQTPGGGYTSGRLTTQYAMAASYGKVEARIKLPTGKGIWPSFWMLGNNISSAGWPQCGEIDVMENLGDQPSYIHSTIHGPGYQNGIGVAYQLATGKFSDDFHVFGVVWSPGEIQFQVDGATYATMTPNSLPVGTNWVFDQPFFLILNLAVGGTWSGYPDSTTVFPQSMMIDYVRYYRDTSQPVINPGQVLDSISLTRNLAPGSVLALSGTGFSTETSTNLMGTTLATSYEGTSVLIGNRTAPLVSVSPSLILAQVPWGTASGTPVNVQVVRNTAASNTESISLTSPAPNILLQNGVAAIWCLTGTPGPGAKCTILGDGFGPTSVPLQDGSVPIGATTVQATCRLTIANHNASVSYCGMAPGTLLNRLDFTYPSGVSTASPTAKAVLTIGSTTVSFLIPSH